MKVMSRIALSETFARWDDIGGLVRAIGLYAVVDRAVLSSKPAKNIRSRWQVIDLAQNYCKTFRTQAAAIAHLLEHVDLIPPFGWDHV